MLLINKIYMTDLQYLKNLINKSINTSNILCKKSCILIQQNCNREKVKKLRC